MKNFGAQNMVGYLKRVLMKKPLQNMSKVNLNIWNYAYPLNQELIDKNYSEFYDIIKKFGTEIIELKIEDNKEELCDSVFTHDPSLVINEGALKMGIHYDYKSTRGDKAMKKEAKRKARIEQRRAKRSSNASKMSENKEMHDIDKPITLEDLTNPDKN